MPFLLICSPFCVDTCCRGFDVERCLCGLTLDAPAFRFPTAKGQMAATCSSGILARMTGQEKQCPWGDGDR